MDNEKKIRAQVLLELAQEWDAEYERRTAISGSYGDMKIRAAYRLASGLAEAKLKELNNG